MTTVANVVALDTHRTMELLPFRPQASTCVCGAERESTSRSLTISHLCEKPIIDGIKSGVYFQFVQWMMNKRDKAIKTISTPDPSRLKFALKNVS